MKSYQKKHTRIEWKEKQVFRSVHIRFQTSRLKLRTSDAVTRLSTYLQLKHGQGSRAGSSSESPLIMRLSHRLSRLDTARVVRTGKNVKCGSKERLKFSITIQGSNRWLFIYSFWSRGPEVNGKHNQKDIRHPECCMLETSITLLWITLPQKDSLSFKIKDKNLSIGGMSGKCVILRKSNE